MLYRICSIILIVASAACSNANDRRVSSLTGPSAVNGASAMFATGVSGPMDVLFPGRGDSFQFRNDLETKYQTSLGRSAGTTFVDREGEVVWTQEYIRYRVNGCDHGTAVQRVMTQIDGGAPGGICAAPPEGVVLFPSRADSLEFRRVLEAKYQQMARGASTSFVDAEGGVIWTQEYLRYRTNSCDHASAEQKVFSQIDGGPVPDVCLQPCTLAALPSGIDVGSSPMSGTFEVRPNRAGCEVPWTASSDASWLTFPSSQTPGAGFTYFNYNVAQNNGNNRRGRITITWSGGSTTFTVDQSGTPYVTGVTLTDPFRSGNQSTNECWFRSSATPCTFTAFANLPGAGAYSYDWNVSYVYGTTKTSTITNNSNTFTITDACGGSGATTEGTPVDLNVTVTITDSAGNTITVRSTFIARLFTC